MKLHRSLSPAQRQICVAILSSFAANLGAFEERTGEAGRLEAQLGEVSGDAAALRGAVDGTKRKDVATLATLEQQAALLSGTVQRAEARQAAAFAELQSATKRAAHFIEGLCGLWVQEVLAGIAEEHLARLYTDAAKLAQEAKNLPPQRAFRQWLARRHDGTLDGVLTLALEQTKTLQAFLTGEHFWSFQGLRGEPI